MALETNINDLLKRYIEMYQHAVPVKCRVTAIDDEDNTIEAEPLNGDVEIKEIYSNPNFKVKIDSIVYIVMLDENIGFVAQYTELTDIVLVSDEYGGLTIADFVTKELNDLRSDLNTLKTAFSSWIPAPNDGGAALKTASASWAGQTLTPVQSEDLQNKKVKHGS